VGSDLDPFHDAVAVATVVDVTHVIPEVLSVDYVARLKLGKIESCIGGFGAVSVGVSGFGDNFA
jgi:hypothetical protein